ncbi:MAG: hypothetical protein ACLFSC_03395 [Wenzhouxiangella sp.]
MRARLGAGWLMLAAVVLSGCSRAPVEEQIRARLEDMVAAVAEGNVRAFLAPVADDFAGDTWQIDRRGARLLLMRELRAHQQLRVRLLDIEVEPVSEERATASFQALLSGGSGLIPEDAGWYRVQTGWRRNGSDWELITATWERVIGR